MIGERGGERGHRVDVVLDDDLEGDTRRRDGFHPRSDLVLVLRPVVGSGWGQTFGGRLPSEDRRDGDVELLREPGAELHRRRTTRRSVDPDHDMAGVGRRPGGNHRQRPLGMEGQVPGDTAEDRAGHAAVPSCADHQQVSSSLGSHGHERSARILVGHHRGRREDQVTLLGPHPDLVARLVGELGVQRRRQRAATGKIGPHGQQLGTGAPGEVIRPAQCVERGIRPVHSGHDRFHGSTVPEPGPRL